MKIFKSNGTVFVNAEGKPFIGLYFIDELTNIAYEYKENQKPELSSRLYTKSVYQTELVRKRLNLPAFVKVPESYKPALTKEDYAQGVISRYFIQKRNLNYMYIVEVSQETFITSPAVANASSHKAVSLYWRIAGKYEYVVEYNKEQVKQGESLIPGLSSRLKKLDEFYREV